MVSTEKKWLSDEEVREFRLSGMSTENKVLAIRDNIKIKCVDCNRIWQESAIKAFGKHPENICPICEGRLDSIPPVAIADILGISREWARKLLERNGRLTNLLRLGRFCPECGKRLERLPKRGMCRECYSLKSKKDVACSGCGISIQVTQPLYNRAMHSDRYKGNFYCSRPCFDSNKGPYQRQRKEAVAFTHVCQTCNKEETVYGSYEKRKALYRKYCAECRLALYSRPKVVQKSYELSHR